MTNNDVQNTTQKTNFRMIMQNNRKIVDWDKIDILSAQIHGRSKDNIIG
jgi:hypothetical protein